MYTCEVIINFATKEYFHYLLCYNILQKIIYYKTIITNTFVKNVVVFFSAGWM